MEERDFAELGVYELIRNFIAATYKNVVNAIPDDAVYMNLNGRIFLVQHFVCWIEHLGEAEHIAMTAERIGTHFIDELGSLPEGEARAMLMGQSILAILRELMVPPSGGVATWDYN